MKLLFDFMARFQLAMHRPDKFDDALTELSSWHQIEGGIGRTAPETLPSRAHCSATVQPNSKRLATHCADLLASGPPRRRVFLSVACSSGAACQRWHCSAQAFAAYVADRAHWQCCGRETFSTLQCSPCPAYGATRAGGAYHTGDHGATVVLDDKRDIRELVEFRSRSRELEMSCIYCATLAVQAQALPEGVEGCCGHRGAVLQIPCQERYTGASGELFLRLRPKSSPRAVSANLSRHSHAENLYDCSFQNVPIWFQSRVARVTGTQEAATGVYHL